MSQLPKTNIVRFSSWPWCAVPRLARSCRHCWRHSFSGSNQLGWRIETVQKYLQNNTGTEEYLLPFKVTTIYVWYELKCEHCTMHNIGQKPDKKAINVQKKCRYWTQMISKCTKFWKIFSKQCAFKHCAPCTPSSAPWPGTRPGSRWPCVLMVACPAAPAATSRQTTCSYGWAILTSM